MIPKGKGCYIWKIERLGGVEKIVNLLKAGGFGHALIKIADGSESYNPLARELATALKAAGIEPLGWQYVYLADPEAEAKTAVCQVQITGCVGFVIDAERQCKNKPTETEIYCDTLAGLMPDDISIGLSSYRFPSYHPEIAWNTWRSITDFDMPQVYWVLGDNPAEQLEKSYLEYSRFYPVLPYVPTGAAYLETSVIPNWKPTPGQVEEFIAACNEHGWNYNFWELYEASVVCPELWPIITGGQVIEQPASDRVRVAYSGGLNIRSAPAVITGNIIGGAYYGSTWAALGRVKDALGREWVQIAPMAYIAGWYTVPA